jgi:hypothetical protein
MSRQLKPMLMGAIFTLVAMGFAYALPHAVNLQPMSDEGTGEVVALEPDCPVDEDGPDDGSEGEGEELVEGEGEELVEGEGEELVEGEGEGEELVEGEGEGEELVEGEGEGEELVEGEGEECEEEDVFVEGEDLEDEGEGGQATNHGRVVRVAAHCDVKGRAHGELVRSIAKDREATVADAESACDEAMAAVQQSGDGERGGKPEKAKTGKPDHAGEGKHPDGSSDDVSSSDADGGTHGKG